MSMDLAPEDCFELWEAAENDMWQAAVAHAERLNAEFGQEVIDTASVYVTFEPGAANRHVGCGCAASVPVARAS